MVQDFVHPQFVLRMLFLHLFSGVCGLFIAIHALFPSSPRCTSRLASRGDTCRRAIRMQVLMLSPPKVINLNQNQGHPPIHKQGFVSLGPTLQLEYPPTDSMVWRTPCRKTFPSSWKGTIACLLVGG